MYYKGIMEETPVGPLMILSEDNYIIRVDFIKTRSDEVDAYLKRYCPDFSITDGFSEELIKVMTQLTEYFTGKRKAFDFNIKLFGTPFYQQCWKSLCDIPYGETISYKKLAERVNSPKAYRAVGQANHNNPISIAIPCHRVLASNNKLGGYGGGLDKKQILLDLEAKHK